METQPPKFEWQLNWKILGFFVMFFPLMVGLGFWQLDRAEQKRTIQQLLLEQQAMPPTTVSTLDQLPSATDHNNAYQSVRLQGRFDTEHIWLLENQMHQGRLGFHVIQAFVLQGGGAVLVDRGWSPAAADPRQMPSVDPSVHTRQLEGRLVLPSTNRLLEGQTFTDQWPRWVLQVDPALMGQHIERALAPWLLQISPADPAALMAQWNPVSMPASKHLGYAFQWFAMAAALCILTVYANSNFHRWLTRRWRRSRA